MAFAHGKDAVVTLNSVDLSEYVNNVEFERSADMHDVTCLGASGHTYASGLTDGSVKLSGIYDSSGTSTPEATIRALIGGAEVTLLWQPAGVGVGKPQDSCTVLVESYNETAPVADMVKWEAELKISGPVVTTNQSV